MVELSSLEHELRGPKETDLHGFQSSTSTPEQHAAPLEAHQQPHCPYLLLVSNSSSTRNSSLLDEYYKRKSDIGIQWKRLQELDFYYQEGLIERAFSKERGDELELGDRQFEENYKARRKIIERDLEVAEAEAEILRARCQDAGLEIINVLPEDGDDTWSIISDSEARISLRLCDRNVHPFRGDRISLPRRIYRWLHHG